MKPNEKSKLYLAIEQAVILPNADELESIAIPDFEFSQEYRKKTDKLTKRRSKKYYPLIKTTFRRTILTIAAAIIALVATACAVKPIREWFTELFITDNKENKNYDIFYTESGFDDTFLQNIEIYYEPTYIPDGFEESERNKTLGHLILDYTTDDNRFMTYTQYLMSVGTSIDSINKTTEKIEMYGHEALLVYDDEYSAVTWKDEDYVYLVAGLIPKDELLKVANSLKPQ